MSSSQQLLCPICNAPAPFRCSQCKAVGYCSQSHQSQDWKQGHKAACKKQDAPSPSSASSSSPKPSARPSAKPSAKPSARSGPAPAFSVPWDNTKSPVSGITSPTDWVKAFPSSAQRYQWLVDCYRMRVDDDYAWGGGNMHGLYADPGDTLTIVQDFTIFCKLCVLRKALPVGWNWAEFLRIAAGLLPYAFEKSDAQEKYGGENVFSFMTTGKPSLRLQGEIVYGSSIMAGATEEEKFTQIEAEMVEWFSQPITAIFAEGAGVFSEVGGSKLWEQLLQALSKTRKR